MAETTLHIHLVSDPTGETIHQTARVCIAQFPDARTIEHVWTLVRSLNHVDAVFTGLERNPGILLMSVVDSDLREEFGRRCTEKHIPQVSVLDPVVDLLGRFLGQPLRNRPGGQRNLDTSYSDLELISGEVRDARRLFAHNQWPVIDITRRSVEETASAVIQLHTAWLEEQSVGDPS